jgi:antitoxin component of MazEF toxin-antitoxin module
MEPLIETEPAVTLERLVEQITDENRHGEIDMGQSVGDEVW